MKSLFSMDDKTGLVSCPQCDSKLNPPLKTTGRQVCKNCGWSNKPRVNSRGPQTPVAPSQLSQFISDIKSKTSSIQATFQSNKKVRYSAIGVAALLLFSATSVYGFDVYQSNQCKTEAKETLSEFAEEWDDVMDRATNSNRMNMQANVSDLQHLKRKAGDIDWPKCSLVAKVAIRVGMQSDIDQLLDFMGGDDTTYIASYSWEVFEDEMAEISQRGKTQKKVGSDDDAKEILKGLYNKEIERIEQMEEETAAEIKSTRVEGESYVENRMRNFKELKKTTGLLIRKLHLMAEKKVI